MRVELLTVGSELISGATVNTNAAYLARRLAEAGLPCARQTAVGDELNGLRAALREILARSQLVLLTGGLGPTFDDVTLEAVAEATGRPLVRHAATQARVRRFYTRRHRRLQQAALRQAALPRGAEALPNPIGTAPGVWLRLPATLVIALPGVPGEMRAIMEQSVLPRLRRLPDRLPSATLTLRTIGVVELSIEAILRRLRLPPRIDVGLYPSLRMVDVRLTATGPGATRAVKRVAAALRRRLGLAVYGVDGQTLSEAVGRLLLRRGATLAVAESCTGGLLTDHLTDTPGSSRYLLGSVVAYANAVKSGCLGVPKETLARHGAVSPQTAGRMARGVRRLLRADVGVAITGIAGPSGGTAKKPVGLAYVAVADPRGALVRRYQFFGDRAAVKMQAAQAAMDALRRRLLER